MKKQILFMSLAACVAFSSCKKEEIDSQNPRSSSKQTLSNNQSNNQQKAVVYPANDEKVRMVLAMDEKQVSQEAEYISNLYANGPGSRDEGDQYTEAEVLSYLELGLNYDFRINTAKTWYFLEQHVHEVVVPYVSGSTTMIVESDMLIAYDDAFTDIQEMVDWDNGIIQRSAVIEKVSDNSTGFTIRVISEIYTSNNLSTPNGIAPGENIYAGKALGGCNSYTTTYADAADRIKYELNFPWISAACANGGYPIRVPGYTISTYGTILFNLSSCVTGNYYAGAANNCMNSTTLQSWSNKAENIKVCFKNGINSSFGSNAFDFGSTNWHWHNTSSVNGYHGGEFSYAREICSPLGLGVGYTVQ